MRVTVNSVSVQGTFRVLDSDGQGVAVTADSSGLELWYRRGGEEVDITPVDLSSPDDAWVEGGLIHVRNGWHRLDIPDGAFVSGADNVEVGGGCDAGVVLTAPIEIEPVATVVVAATAVALDVINSSGDLLLRRGDKITFSITDLGSLVGRTGLSLIIKRNRYVGNEDAELLVTEADGLVTINGSSASDPSAAALSVINSSDGDITVTVKAAASILMDLFSAGLYEVQILDSDGEPMSLAEGSVEVIEGTTGPF